MPKLDKCFCRLAGGHVKYLAFGAVTLLDMNLTTTWLNIYDGLKWRLPYGMTINLDFRAIAISHNFQLADVRSRFSKAVLN